MSDEAAQVPEVEAPDRLPSVPDPEAVDSSEVAVPEGGEVVTPTPAIPVADVLTLMIEIYNPATAGDDTSLVTREAYDEVWAEKGWRVVAGRMEDGSLVLEPAPEINPEGDGSDGDDGGSTGTTDTEPALVGETSEASAGTESDAGPRGARRKQT